MCDMSQIETTYTTRGDSKDHYECSQTVIHLLFLTFAVGNIPGEFTSCKLLNPECECYSYHVCDRNQDGPPAESQFTLLKDISFHSFISSDRLD